MVIFVGSENEGKKITGQKSGVEIVNKLLPIARDVLDVNKSKEASNGSDDKSVNGLINKLFKKG